MRINPEPEPLRQFDFASIVALEAILWQHCLQTEAVLLFLSVPLVLCSVDVILNGQQLIFHINSDQARDLSSTMDRKLHICRCCWHNTRNDIYYKLQLDWRKARPNGVILVGERSLRAPLNTARLKLGVPH